VIELEDFSTSKPSNVRNFEFQVGKTKYSRSVFSGYHLA